jgi:Rrf2 family protein
MKLHQATRYAIWVTVYLAAHPEKQLSAAELSNIFGISRHHLAKILRSLSVAKLVSSTRGPGGGCTFVADPKRVTLFDIVSRFEDGLWDDETQTTSARVGEELVEVSRVMNEIDRITKATLRSVTVHTIINSARRGARDETELAGPPPENAV